MGYYGPAAPLDPSHLDVGCCFLDTRAPYAAHYSPEPSDQLCVRAKRLFDAAVAQWS